MSADAGSSTPLDRAAILNIVKEQLAEILEKTPSDISETEAFTEMGADSLALIELVEALEEKLSTYVPGFHNDDEDLENLGCVNDAVDYVAAKLQGA